MEMRRAFQRRGFTLVEVLVASMLTIALLGLVSALFVAANHMIGLQASSLLISRDLSLGAERLRNELKETALGAIRVRNGELPSLTLVTARGKDGHSAIDAQGTPDWMGWAHYLLEDGESSEVGVLTRWTEYPRDPMPYPLISAADPYAIPKGAEKTVILRNVVRPGAKLTDGKSQPLAMSDGDGFSVRFVRLDDSRAYTTSNQNPSETSAEPADIHANTRLLEVKIRTYSRTQTGKVDTVGMHFMVCPRY